MTRPAFPFACLILTLWLWPPAAFSWGERGHEIVALIAEHYMTSAARSQVAVLLAGDASGLTRDTGIAAESTWADKLRDSDRDTTQVHYRQTRAWHYIDIELDDPDVDAACFGHPKLPPGRPASEGPVDDCIVDKIEQFRRELASRTVDTDERRVALQFLLHLIGDLHQPLHAADRRDHGGNDQRVRSADLESGNLHHFWDTVFVERLGPRPETVATALIVQISPARRRAWSAGSPRGWARQSFRIARSHTYGRLPNATGEILLDERYEADARAIVALQLERAGVRLARVLNQALR
jgi:hypothetical protein